MPRSMLISRKKKAIVEPKMSTQTGAHRQQQQQQLSPFACEDTSRSYLDDEGEEREEEESRLENEQSLLLDDRLEERSAQLATSLQQRQAYLSDNLVSAQADAAKQQVESITLNALYCFVNMLNQQQQLGIQKASAVEDHRQTYHQTDEPDGQVEHLDNETEQASPDEMMNNEDEDHLTDQDGATPDSDSLHDSNQQVKPLETGSHPTKKFKSSNTSQKAKISRHSHNKSKQQQEAANKKRDERLQLFNQQQLYLTNEQLGDPHFANQSKRRSAAPSVSGSDDVGVHSCQDCGKRYSTSSNLARHRQTHRAVTDKRARTCQTCNKIYTSMPAFSMHVKTHTQDCLCFLCGKAFSRPWLLQGHMRTHTGEKPFKCEICTKAFADKSNLRAHIQTHSDTKPFICGRCNKAFALNSYLNKHRDSTCMRANSSQKEPLNLKVSGRSSKRNKSKQQSC